MGMRKWIIITAVIAGLGGMALGLVGGAYMGFWATKHVSQMPLYERSVSGAAIGSTNWQMALDGDMDTLKRTNQGQALMHASALNILYEDLDKGQRMSVDRTFRRILDLAERDESVTEPYTGTIEQIRERVEDSDAGERP